MDEIPLDIFFQMMCDREKIERAKILPLAPPGLYTATCDEANWLEDGDDRFPGRLLLRCCFWAKTSDGKQARVSFKLSPQVWCKDPFNKTSVKLTDENQASLDGWEPDLTSERWRQAKVALKQLRAISDDASDIQVAEAMTHHPLTFAVKTFKPDSDEINYVNHINLEKTNT